jgi:hypothetical protein
MSVSCSKAELLELHDSSALKSIAMSPYSPMDLGFKMSINIKKSATTTSKKSQNHGLREINQKLYNNLTPQKGKIQLHRNTQSVQASICCHHMHIRLPYKTAFCKTSWLPWKHSRCWSSPSCKYEDADGAKVPKNVIKCGEFNSWLDLYRTSCKSSLWTRLWVVVHKSWP